MSFNYYSRWALRYQDDNINNTKGIASLQERRNALQAWLNCWFNIQTVYIPVAQSLRALQHGNDDGASGCIESDELENTSLPSAAIDAEKAELFLPSRLPSSLWSTGCMPGLHKIELELRIAQANDALEQMKHHLCIHSSLVHYKIAQVSGPGQKANTRARILISRLWEKITRSAEQYRASCAALLLLDPSGDWNKYLKPLLTSDLKGPKGNSPDDQFAAMSKRSKQSRGNGEGFREVSWIWRVQCRVSRTNTGELTSVERSRAISQTDLDKCE